MIIAALIAVLPLVLDQERDAGIAPGHLSFELQGPADAPLVVLIHGVSGPMMVWDKTVPALVAAGFRTLRFDLFGRGEAGRPPDAAYDLETYLAQLDAVLAAASIAPGAPLRLVGSSMGAIIASEYTSRHPERVRALALVGPAGFPLQASPLAALMAMPLIGDWAMRVFGDRTLADHNRRYFFAPAAFTDFQARFEAQMHVAGSKRAILRTVRNVPLQAYLDGYERVGRTPLPKIVIWGREDQAFPYENSRALLPRLPGATLVTVEAAGHLPQYEQDQVTSPALAAFLRSSL